MVFHPQSNVIYVNIEDGTDYNILLDKDYYINNEPFIIGFEFKLYSLIDINKIFKIYKQNKHLSILNLDFFNFFETSYKIVIHSKSKKKST